MNWKMWTVVALVTVAAGPAVVAADDAAADLKSLAGTWEVTGIEVNGKKMDLGKGAPEKAVVKGGKVSFFSGGKEMATFRDLKMKLFPKKKPREVNLIRGSDEGLPCIYEVSATQWKLALPLVPKERKPGEKLMRPKSFDTKDRPVMLFVLKRKKG
jgi:uncharacterized protein (TIGR03067 family)